MIQGLQMLCGVVLLAVITVGQTWGAEAIDIRLQSGSPLEERGRDQLRRLLRTYDLHKWLFTRDVLIQSGVIPHSHPVLTLNTRYVDDDTAQLATFVHEQLHWFLTDHVERAKTNAALTELRALYPTVPTALPEGAMGGEEHVSASDRLPSGAASADSTPRRAKCTAAIGALDPLYVGVPDRAHGDRADRRTVKASWGSRTGAVKRDGVNTGQSLSVSVHWCGGSWPAAGERLGVCARLPRRTIACS